MTHSELIDALAGCDLNKEIVVMAPSMDPIYYDSSHTTPNMIHIMYDPDYGTLLGIIETDESNNIIKDTINDAT